MVELHPLRIALVVETREDAPAIQALLPASGQCCFQVDTFAGPAALEQALQAGGRHDAYLVQPALIGDPAALSRAVATARPVVVLARSEEPSRDAAFLEAGAADCLVVAALTPALLAHSIHRGVLHARYERAERRLVAARKMQAIARFAGGVAHDFNNLLTAMLGYAEMLRESLDPDDIRRDDVAEIQRAGERATTLTRQLLTFGLRSPVQPKPLRLDDLVERVSVILAPLLGDGVAVTTVTGSATEIIRADAAQLELMIANLARNARDAMPTGGRVRLETAIAEIVEGPEDGEPPPGRYATLLVADEGTGMTPEVMSHLYEPFFTTKGKGKGTGLGLPVVYGIVKQAGGHITVDSAPGKGTRVRVYFPVVAS